MRITCMRRSIERPIPAKLRTDDPPHHPAVSYRASAVEQRAGVCRKHRRLLQIAGSLAAAA
jgi:hypothetical protein